MAQGILASLRHDPHRNVGYTEIHQFTERDKAVKVVHDFADRELRSFQKLLLTLCSILDRLDDAIKFWRALQTRKGQTSVGVEERHLIRKDYNHRSVDLALIRVKTGQVCNFGRFRPFD